MKKLPPTVLISETNFHNSWARAVRRVLRDGRDTTIGDMSEPKPIRDACVLFELTGNAIKQIENRELHPQFPFPHIDQYCETFTREYLTAYFKKPEHDRFSYLYFERLTNHFIIDQVVAMNINLGYQIKHGISSNRNQIITWDPDEDMGNPASPCLQRIWIRYLGDKDVEVHLTWRCYDEDTEVLTLSGWKNFADVDMGDEIATLNEESNELEYHIPTSLFAYNYDGDMYHFKGKKVDLLVTPNHQMYVKRYPSKEYNFMTAEECKYANTIIKKTCSWTGEHVDMFVLPETVKYRRITDLRNGETVVPQREIDMDEWLNFLGWFVSEGCLSFSSRSHHVILSQQREEHRADVRDAFINIGYNVYESGASFITGNKQLYKCLETQGKQNERFVPDYVKSLGPEQIKIFLRSLFLGDGHKLFFDDDYTMRFDKSGEYTTVSKRLADDVQELLIKIGVQSTISMYDRDEYHQRVYRIRPSRYNESWIKTRDIEHYSGKIYCCDVRNHLIMVRRNGITHWCGNSRDLYTAWQANVVAIIDMLNREVIRPNNCRIVRLVEFIDSLHVYDSDHAAAQDVEPVPVNPQG